MWKYCTPCDPQDQASDCSKCVVSFFPLIWSRLIYQALGVSRPTRSNVMFKEGQPITAEIQGTLFSTGNHTKLL